MPTPKFEIRRGVCSAMFVFDIAMAIDLDHAQRLAASGPGEPHRGTLRPAGLIGSARKAPPYFEYRPAPLQVRMTGEAIPLGAGTPAFETEPGIELLVFDFGAVSITYRVPLAGRTLEAIMDLSERLFDCAPLAQDARARIEALARQLAPALLKPGTTPQVEDYVCYELQDVRESGAADEPVAPGKVLDQAAELLARILRSERAGLSREETDDALSCRVSYGPQDAAVIDWNAAILLDREAEDVRAVLEFANVELLEMRFLDDRLDEILEDAYASLGRTGVGLKALFPTGSATLRRLAQLQMDSALLFENVNNALKLIGDQYLARVYRLAGQRFHLPERDQTIERKLSTLESIYTKLHDHEAGRRADLLTWTIILLIAFEIVLGLVMLGH